MDVIEGLSRKQVLDALGRYQRRGVIEIDEALINKLVAAESDRGLVIILGSWIEDKLAERILELFPAADEKQRKILSRAGAPLGNFVSLLQLARGAGIIDDDVSEFIDVIRNMRNACSHSRQDISLRTHEMRRALALMLDETDGIGALEEDDGLALKVAFISCAGFVLGYLSGETVEAATGRIRDAIRDALRGTEQIPWREKQIDIPSLGLRLLPEGNMPQFQPPASPK